MSECTRIEFRNEGTAESPRYATEWDGVKIRANTPFGLNYGLDFAGAPRPRDLAFVDQESSDE